MFKKMMMKTKIIIGFLGVLTLLIIISTVSIIQLTIASNGFKSYRELARDTILAGQLQANMLMVRMNVKDFIITHSDKDEEEFSNYYKLMTGFLEDAQKNIKNTKRAALIDSVDNNIDVYYKGFLTVEKFMNERDDIVYNYLDVQGPLMEKKLSEILDSAEKDRDTKAAFNAAICLKHLLLARLYVNKFLDTNNLETEERVIKEFELMEDSINVLNKSLQNRNRRNLLLDIVKSKKIYTEKFGQLKTIIIERNKIIDNTLDKIGPEVAKNVDDVKLSIKKDQDTLGPKLQASNIFANITIIIVSVIAIFLAIGAIVLTTTSILKQLGADPAVIDNITKNIALGNLEVNLSNQNTKNEGVYKSVCDMVESLKYKLEILKQIAEGSGDFTIDVLLASEKDILGKTIAKMLDSLNDILGQVNSSITQVDSGVLQLSSASQILSQGASEQASSLEEISSSITEINSQSKQNAESAENANKYATKAKDNAIEGNKMMTELVDAMSKINTSSDEIKKIVKVIDDIAFQTNLLALNANVEAARAGKYGKGFAVVAEEVRNLASRSADAVKETTDMVENSIKNIVSSNDLVDKTSKQLEEIVNGAEEVVNLVEEITFASREQAQGLDQIAIGVGQIDQVTQSNTANAEESASVAEELSSQTQLLKNMISKFKLKNQNIDNNKFIEKTNDNTGKFTQIDNIKNKNTDETIIKH